MAEERLRACVGIEYPADEETYERVLDALAAGRRPRQHPDEFEYRRVEAGGRCDDLPERLRGPWIEAGTVEVVGDGADITEMNAPEAIELVESADAGQLDALEAAERGGSARITVLRAIESRRGQ